MTSIDALSESPAGGTWAEPTFSSVFSRAALGGQIDAKPRLRDVMPIFVLAAGFALVASIEVILDDPAIVFWFVGMSVVTGIFHAGEQLRAGRGWSRVVAALAGNVALYAAVFATWATVAVVVAPTVHATALWERLQSVASGLPITDDHLILVFIALALVLIAYAGRRIATGGWGKPTKAELRRAALYRDERAARLAATGREAVPLLPWRRPLPGG